MTAQTPVLSGQIPYSQEAEEAVIGACQINPEAFDSLALWLRPDDFYILRHGFIWAAMGRVRARGDAIDYVTLQEELRAAGRLMDIGGPAYLTRLQNAVPTSLHAEVYGRLVQRAAVRRRLLACADQYRALALDEERSTEEVLAEAEARLLKVRDASFSDDQPSFQQLLGQFFDLTEERMKAPERALGVPTGFRAVDDLLAGLHRSDFVILAGRPGMGKTAMMLCIALNAAKAGARVGFASQEMDWEQIIARLASMEARINLQALRMGRLDQTEWRRFVEAMGRMAKLRLTVDDSTQLTPEKLRAKAIRWMRDDGLDLLMVDYLQIMASSGAFRPDNRTAEVGYFARSLKQLARELRIPVLAAAQLSRALETRQDKRPQLSDLRESGELEQEADIVAFLYRDVVYNEATEFPNRADLIVAKHRNGPTGTIPLHFEKSLTKFTDARVESIDLSGL